MATRVMRRIYQHEVDVDMLNTIKSLLASSEQSLFALTKG